MVVVKGIENENTYIIPFLILLPNDVIHQRYCLSNNLKAFSSLNIHVVQLPIVFEFDPIGGDL